MVNSYINDLYYSFCLFVDHQILNKGAAFTNYSGSFYRVNDPELPNNNVYASPYKQFCYDFGVTGATVPTGVYINNTFAIKGVSGLKIDYLNGRVILSGGAAYSNLSISGNYSVKSFNLYPTTQSDEELIFETKYQIQPSYARTLSGIDKKALTVPGIFITNTNFRNETHSFGGLCDTITNIHMLILADSKDQLDAVGSLLVDEKYANFPIVSKTPLNYYGDFKSGNYNYLSYINPTGQPLAYISKSDFYKLSNKDFNNKYPDLRIGFVDMEIYYLRMPDHGLS